MGRVAQGTFLTGGFPILYKENLRRQKFTFTFGHQTILRKDYHSWNMLQSHSSSFLRVLFNFSLVVNNWSDYLVKLRSGTTFEYYSYFMKDVLCEVDLPTEQGSDIVAPLPYYLSLILSSVQSLSRVRLFATPWIAAHQASQSITNSRSPPKPMSIALMMPSNHLILCHPLLLLPPIPPSIRAFSNESTLCMRWPKYWGFSFSISSSNEHLGLIFRMDWLDLLAVQGTLKSLLQHHSSKASIERCYMQRCS